MAKVRALIIGVSKYTAIRANNLEFCKNDMFAILHGLTIRRIRIIGILQEKIVK